MLHTLLLWLILPMIGHFMDKPLQVNDIVYIQAPNGLTLRKTPAKDGEKVALLPFNGAPLTVLAPASPASSFTAETIGTFAIKGGWAQVKTKDGLVGYLFDGYLSRYAPIPAEKRNEDLPLMDAFYRTISLPKGKPTKLPAKQGTIERTQQYYTDGTRFEMMQYEGGAAQLLELPADKFSMQEALVLFRAVWFKKEKTSGTYNATQKRLVITGDGGYTEFTLQSKGNRLVLQFSVAD